MTAVADTRHCPSSAAWRTKTRRTPAHHGLPSTGLQSSWENAIRRGRLAQPSGAEGRTQVGNCDTMGPSLPIAWNR